MENFEQLLQSSTRPDGKAAPGYVAPAAMRVANYRESTGRNGAVEGGARVGMPTRPEDWDLDGLMDRVESGRVRPEDGMLNGFGRFLEQQGEFVPVQAARDEDDYPHPSGGDAAWTDRSREGTPGRGTPIEDKYSRDAGRTVLHIRRQNAALKFRLREAVRQAEVAERAGRLDTMAHFDDLAESFAADLQSNNAILAELEATDPYGDAASGLRFD